jgi:tRNA(Arg) A34 adenosine deaminase TadA
MTEIETKEELKIIDQNHQVQVQVHIEYMNEAIELAKVAALIEKTGGPFGAIIVNNEDGKIIGRGYNQVLSKNDPTCHAEMVAIRDACHTINSHDLSGTTMYTTGQCCPMCYTAGVWSHIGKIYYASSTIFAEKYGNFRDEIMYLDIQNQKNPELRKLPSFHLKESNEMMENVWKDYSNLINKIQY